MRRMRVTIWSGSGWPASSQAMNVVVVHERVEPPGREVLERRGGPPGHPDDLPAGPCRGRVVLQPAQPVSLAASMAVSASPRTRRPPSRATMLMDFSVVAVTS
jgi:hypothetical protein